MTQPGGAGPIDTAFVEIQPDAHNFARDAERDIDRVIDTIAADFRRLTERLEVIFERVGDEISNEFFDVARSAERTFDAIATDADRAGDGIAHDIERGTESAERSLSELARHADRNFNAVSRQADVAAGRLGKSLGGVGSLAGLAVGGAAAALTAGLGAIATFGLKSAAALEQSRIQFESLLGSAQKGNEVFAELQKFAATTPFEFPDVAHAAARFLAFDDAVGIADDQLQNFLTTVGNVISVTGGGAEALGTVTQAMGQIASTGKLTLDNLNQISEALPGFSGAAAIAAATGQTTAQVMEKISKGEISAAQGIAALLQGMQKFPGAAGAMEKQSQTLLGVFSTFKDTIGQSLATAFEPAIPAIKKSLTEITPVLGEALGEFAPQLGQAIASLLPVIASLAKGLAPVLGIVSGALGALGGGLGPTLESLGKVIGVLLKPLLPLVAIIGQVADVLAQALLPVADALAPVIAELAKPIGDLLLALLPLIVPLAQLLAVVIQILNPLIQLTSVLLSLLATKAVAPVMLLLAKAITLLLTPLSEFAEFLANVDWGAVGRAILGGLTVAAKAVGNFFVALGRVLSRLPGQFVDFLRSLPGLLVDLIELAFDEAIRALGRQIGLLLFIFIQLPRLIINALLALPGLLASFFENLWNDSRDRARRGVDDVVSFAESLPSRILNALTSLPGRLFAFFTNMWTTVRRLAVDAFNSVVSTVASAPGRLISFAGSFLNAGRRLINGFITGFRNVGSFIGDVAGSIVSTVRGFLNQVIAKLNDGIKDIDDILPGSLPRIPLLARGGIAFGPSIIGEKPGGRGEAAIPLDDARALALLKNALGGGTSSGNVTFEAGAVTVVFSGVVPTEAEARRTGQAVGEGIADALDAGATRVNVRSI